MLFHGISYAVDMEREIWQGKTLDTEKLGIHHSERGANSLSCLLLLPRISSYTDEAQWHRPQLHSTERAPPFHGASPALGAVCLQGKLREQSSASEKLPSAL